ncbi:MAG: iron-containing redox enzyme family protein [Nitrospira sp.]|nr:MAG: iron-containing redox enzyme family protein [Nitrospira sp.]
MKPATRSSAKDFREQLLRVMDQKHHWAWPHFAGEAVTKAQLKIHFVQEYGVYVRDFPVLLARVHGQNPPAPVRRMLAENIFEEDTGGLSLGKSHPDLFLVMMRGLGLSEKDFEPSRLLPAATTYRRWLDRMTAHQDWAIGSAVMTIFVEGSVKDRQEILHPSKLKTSEEIEDYVRHHPLVQHHRLSPDCMDLIRAHQKVEAGHRHDAYAMVLDYVTERRRRQAILTCLKTTLQLWLRYRDAVARACGLKKS